MKVSLKGWVYWSIGALAYIAAVTHRTSFGVASVDAVARFHIGPVLLSLFPVLQLIVYALAQIPVGIALDHFGSRRLISTGALVMAGGQTLLAFAGSYPVALLGRGIVGLGDAMTFISVLRVVASWFPKERVAMMTQIVGLLGWFGQLISGQPFAFLLRNESWSFAFATLSITSLIMSVCAYSLIRDADLHLISGEWPSIQDVKEKIKTVWHMPAARLGFWSHFTTPFSSQTFALIWGMPFMVNALGYSKTQASNFISTNPLFGMIAGLLIGYFTPKMQAHLQRMTYLLTIYIIFAWSMLLLWPGKPGWFVVLFMIAAISAGGPGSLIGIAHARKHIPREHMGTADGLINSAGFYAALLNMLLIGAVLQICGDYSLASFRWAFLVQFPLWLIGLRQIRKYVRLTGEN